MYTIVYSNQYKRAYKKLKRSGRYNLVKLDRVLELLLLNMPLPKQYQDHPLKGRLKNLRECHIFCDLLLVYKKEQDKLLLFLINLGSHDKLF